MKEFLKISGIILVLAGVAVLAMHFYNGWVENTTLVTGLVLILVGTVDYVIVNKRIY